MWGKNKKPQQGTPPPPYGELLREIDQAEIFAFNHDPKIKDCSYVASYSWLNRGNPSIIIPDLGKPPAWTPPAVPRRLEPDKGDFFRDPNAARYPLYPMGAAVQAVLKQNPEFRSKNIDIFACASTLGNLARFARGIDKEFRFVMETVGTTVFFIRRENSPTELIPDVRGYGHTFPEEYTTWEEDVKGSVAHQRIIQYTFGGLHLLVRFEADGYFRKKEETSKAKPDSGSLIDAFGNSSVSQTVSTSQRPLQIEEGGQPIPQKDVFEIKTRSMFDHKTRTIKKEIDMTDITPKLWISQIPTLVFGFHNRGLFEDIRVQDLREDVEKWEEDNEGDLQRLASLLHELCEYSREFKTGLEVCRSTGSETLEIRELAGEGLEALPSDLRARWIRADSDGKEANTEDECGPESASELDQELYQDAENEGSDRDSDDQSDRDYTACSAEDCGYCGHCHYWVARPGSTDLSKVGGRLSGLQLRLACIRLRSVQKDQS